MALSGRTSSDWLVLILLENTVVRNASPSVRCLKSTGGPPMTVRTVDNFVRAAADGIVKRGDTKI